MKLICVYLLLFLNLFDNDLSHIRYCYLRAADDEKITTELIAATQNNNEPVIKGYNGAATIIMAKHYLNPISKLKTFNNGKKILESAIEKDKLNPELKFLRLSIQENSPSFLGYHNNIKEDKLFLIKCLPTITDDELKKIITSYLNHKKKTNLKNRKV